LAKNNPDKRAKFVRLAEGRVQGALSAIRKIGNLANKRSYDYDEMDIKKIVKALREALGEVERKFDPSSGPREKTFKL
jgi:hypothetical protein